MSHLERLSELEAGFAALQSRVAALEAGQANASAAAHAATASDKAAVAGDPNPGTEPQSTSVNVQNVPEPDPAAGRSGGRSTGRRG